MNFTVFDISEYIKRLEKKYNLFEKKIDSIYFWKIVRFKLYNEILRELGIYDEAHPKSSNSILRQGFNAIRKDIVLIKNNALRKKEKSEIVILESPRKFRYMNKQKDIYTFFIEEELQDSDLKILHLNSITNNLKEEVLRESILEGVPLIYRKAIYKFIKIKYSKENYDFLRILKNDINQNFKISINIISIINKYLSYFIINRKYYRKLLNVVKPDKIFLVCSYGKESLISAAHDNNIEVIELQHGTMSKEHLGYSFPSNIKINYFPDRILLFGKYWSDITDIPLQKNNIINYGYPYLEQQLIKYNTIKKVNNQTIFLSQGTIGEKLSDIAYKFAISNAEYYIIYKLHPSEYKVWKEKYPILNEASYLENFLVIDNNSENLHYLLGSSEYQVGVYSTVIYEGLAMSLKTILVNLPGIEHMTYLIENNIVKLAYNHIDLEKCITSNTFNDYDREYFFNNWSKNTNLSSLLGS